MKKISKLAILASSVGLGYYVAKLIKDNVEAVTVNIESKGKLRELVGSEETKEVDETPDETKPSKLNGKGC